MQNRIEAFPLTEKQQPSNTIARDKLLAFFSSQNAGDFKGLCLHDVLEFTQKYALDITTLKDKNGNTVLHLALMNFHVPEFFLIALVNHIPVEQKLNNTGYAPLHLAGITQCRDRSVESIF